MSRLLVVFSVMMFCLSTLGAASKCDDKIIKQIKKKFWNKTRCTPKDLFRTGVFMSPEIIKATTTNYYPDEENIRCAYSTFEGAQINLYVDYFSSSSASCQEPTTVMNVIEKDGILIEEEKDIYRYHVYAGRYGVSAIYKCSKKGEKGPPEGMIKVSAHGYEDQALAECIEGMASLGIHMCEKSYSDDCVNVEVHH